MQLLDRWRQRHHIPCSSCGKRVEEERWSLCQSCFERESRAKVLELGVARQVAEYKAAHDPDRHGGPGWTPGFRAGWEAGLAAGAAEVEQRARQAA